MPMIDHFVQELAHEGATTRTMLAAVPEEHLAWKPHEKSMTLGRLAGHVAEIPAWSKDICGAPELDIAAAGYEAFEASSSAELLETFDRSVATFKESAVGVTDDAMFETWRFRAGDDVHFELPRIAVLRSFIFSHMIHHRAQLSVYLRLLDVPVPSSYGPTADAEGF